MPEPDDAKTSRAEWRRLARVPQGKPAWDKDRTKALFEEYKEKGSEEARDQLIVSHLNLVRFIAAKYRNKGEQMDDLIQVGTVGLIKAIDRFDPSRGLEFTTYATPTIKGEIQRHFRDRGWDVRVSRRLQELSAKVKKAQEDLSKELGRSPKVEEVAERVGASVDDVLEAMEAGKAYSATSLEQSTTSDEDDGPTLEDRYIAPAESETDNADDRMSLEEARQKLSPREQEIIRMQYEENLTQTQMAARLGISQVQVSRLLNKTLAKLRSELNAGA